MHEAPMMGTLIRSPEDQQALGRLQPGCVVVQLGHEIRVEPLVFGCRDRPFVRGDRGVFDGSQLLCGGSTRRDHQAEGHESADKARNRASWIARESPW